MRKNCEIFNNNISINGRHYEFVPIVTESDFEYFNTLSNLPKPLHKLFMKIAEDVSHIEVIRRDWNFSLLNSSGNSTNKINTLVPVNSSTTKIFREKKVN